MTEKPSAIFQKEFNEWTTKFHRLFIELMHYTYREDYTEVRDAFIQLMVQVRDAEQKMFSDIQLDEAETELAKEEGET